MATLRLYIELEQERFGDAFDYELIIDPLLMEDSIKSLHYYYSLLLKTLFCTDYGI